MYSRPDCPTHPAFLGVRDRWFLGAVASGQSLECLVISFRLAASVSTLDCHPANVVVGARVDVLLEQFLNTVFIATVFAWNHSGWFFFR